MSIEVRVPTLGESVTEATVSTWSKKPGDSVAVDEILCELETDKVMVEVPSPAAGTLAEITAPEGTSVGVDGLLGVLAEDTAAAGDAPTPVTAAPQTQAATPHAAAEDAQPITLVATSSGGADAAEGTEGKQIDVMVPALGESVTEATVATWFKSVGDAVAQDEMLCELETDKVSVEVPAPANGVLAEIVAPQGATVAANAKLAVLSGATTTAGAASPSTASNNTAPAATPTPAPNAARADIENAPSAQKLMAEANLSPDQVQGTGRDGRIMKEDVLNALTTSRTAPAPAQAARAPVSVADAPREERVKMTRLRKTIATRLKDAQNTAAILTTYNEVDMTEVMALRKTYKEEFEKKHGVRLGFMSFFTKACCHALHEIPEVNAEIDGDDIVYKNYVHMGIAASTPQGLVVPVIRDADQKSFATLEKEIAEKGKSARDGKLSMADMQGGTFTISNGGVYGSLMSAPILNPPQSGILGMHKIQDRPVVVGGDIKIRPMMYLALSYDHRIVDGKGAVTFLVRVKDALEDPRRLLMDL